MNGFEPEPEPENLRSPYILINVAVRPSVHPPPVGWWVGQPVGGLVVAFPSLVRALIVEGFH